MNGFDEAWLKAYQAKAAEQHNASSKFAQLLAPIPAKKIIYRAGIREDIGPMYFRSQWEANYARYLNLRIKLNEIDRWSYEPITFWFERIKRGVRSYKPDFQIWSSQEEPYFIELKGYMDPKSKTKMARMARYYPTVKVVLVGDKEYRGLEKTVSALIPKWERTV